MEFENNNNKLQDYFKIRKRFRHIPKSLDSKKKIISLSGKVNTYLLIYIF